MDIHVLSGDGSNWNVAFHFSVPNANNAVAVNYRTALLNSKLGGTTALPDGDGTAGTISAAEKALILAGAVYEHQATWVIETWGTTNAQLRATLRTMYAREEAKVLAEIQRKLRYFGHVEDKA